MDTTQKAKVYFTSRSVNFGFCSNFYKHEFEYDGRVWPTSEHAYQAMKSEDFSVQESIRGAVSPGEAKRLAKSIEIRPNWDDEKIGWMTEILEAKFSVPALRNKLKETTNIELVEYAPHGDQFWGVTPDYVGQNNLGKVLMSIRNRI